MNKTFKCIVFNESAADFQHNGIQNLLFRQIKGSTTLSETEFRKIMKAIADYLKMLKLYEKIFCDSGKNQAHDNRMYALYFSTRYYSRLLAGCSPDEPFS